MPLRYRAPATAYAFERPPWALWALLSVGLLVAGVLLTWAAQPAATFWQRALAVALMLVATLTLSGLWRRWAGGVLLWNGECWALQAQHLLHAAGQDAEPVVLEVGLDGGSWLWLKARKHPVKQGLWRRETGVVWLYLSQRRSPVQWGDLRRAVYSPAVSLAKQG
ncbi:MAG: hypothetical protein RR473_03405 [Comamonas sp.]